MKNVTIYNPKIIFMALLTFFLAINELYAADEGLRLSIKAEPEKDKYLLGEEVMVRCFLHNDLDTPLLVHEKFVKIHDIEPSLSCPAFSIFRFGGSMSGRGGGAPYKRDFLLSQYKEIKPNSITELAQKKLLLNAAGMIGIYCSYENEYDYYYPLLNGHTEGLGEKTKLENAWTGWIHATLNINVENKPCPEFEAELDDMLKRLLDNKPVNSYDIKAVISKGPGYASGFFLKELDKIPELNRLLLFNAGLLESMGTGDGFRIMENIIELIKKGYAFTISEKMSIDTAIRSGMKGIHIDNDSKWYYFEEYYAQDIDSLLFEGKYSTERDVEGLIKKLEDEDPWTQRAALVALGEMGDNRAVEPIIQKLHDINGEVRKGAINALVKIGDKRATIPLIEMLKDDALRDSAIFALGRLKDERAVEPLIKLLTDKDGIIRTDAAKALGYIGDKRAVPPLIEILKDGYNMFQINTLIALKQITSMDFGDPQREKSVLIKKWLEWWEKEGKAKYNNLDGQ